MSDANTNDPYVKDLLPGYIARRREELVRLEEALAAGDFGVLRTTGHNLHGSGGAYGLPRISEIGKNLELAARNHDAQQVSQALATLRDYVKSL